MMYSRSSRRRFTTRRSARVLRNDSRCGFCLDLPDLDLCRDRVVFGVTAVVRCRQRRLLPDRHDIASPTQSCLSAPALAPPLLQSMRDSCVPVSTLNPDQTCLTQPVALQPSSTMPLLLLRQSATNLDQLKLCKLERGFASRLIAV